MLTETEGAWHWFLYVQKALAATHNQNYTITLILKTYSSNTPRNVVNSQNASTVSHLRKQKTTVRLCSPICKCHELVVFCVLCASLQNIRPKNPWLTNRQKQKKKNNNSCCNFLSPLSSELVVLRPSVWVPRGRSLVPVSSCVA